MAIVLFASGLFINAVSIHDTDLNLNSLVETNNAILDGAVVPCVDVEELGGAARERWCQNCEWSDLKYHTWGECSFDGGVG